MKFLVTGGLGFIGSNFIRGLLVSEDVDDVLNLDNLSYGSNPANLKDLKGSQHYAFVEGDITDFELVRKLVQEVDIVVNFAAASHVDRSISNPTLFFRSNAEGTYTLLEAIRLAKTNIRLMQVSTDEVYGDIAKGSFTEEDRLKPSSPYSSSKAAGDLFCLAYHRTYGINVTVTRCTNNFGPYQFPEKLVPKTITRANLGLKVPIYGSGKNVRDWLYVMDHCKAIESVLKYGKAGQTYNISSGNELENITIVRKILKIMGKSEDLIEFVEDRPGHDIRYSLDSSKVRRELRWAPKYEFEEALNKTVSWYDSNAEWCRPLADNRTLHPTPWKLGW